MSLSQESARQRDLKIALAVLLAVLAIVWGIAVHRLRDIRARNAAASEGMDPETWPCAHDAELYCAGVERGGGKINACLEEHDRELSPACAQYRENTDGADDWVLACGPELQSVCAGRFHQIDCLKSHQEALSAHCRSRLRNYENSDQWRRACFEDAARLCSGSPEDQARACLAKRTEELGTSCRIYYAAHPTGSR